MTDRIEAYAAFARMMELGSFSAVGRAMRLSQSTVSKHIAGLEAELGVQLFHRTTRRISPTPEAGRILEHVQRMLESLDTAKAVSRGEHPETTGHLRIAVPGSLGRSQILPLVPQYLDRHPLVSIEAVVTDDVKDLIAEGFELGIVVTEPKGGALMSRVLRTFEWVVTAAPDYLETHGTPETPVDLERHLVIVSTQLAESVTEFDSEHGRQAVRIKGRFRTNSDEAAHDAAVAGTGIAILPSWLANPDVEAGRLTALLGDYYLPPISVSLIYPQTRFLSRRARSFIDYIAPELARGAGRTSPRPPARNL